MIANLSWNANTEADLSHYVLYYGTVSGVYTDQRLDTDTEMILSGLPDGARVYFAITAVDNSGNESSFSTETSKLNKRCKIRIA